MSIRALASELYKAQQKVHKLQDQLETAGINEKDHVHRELKQAETECNQLRRIIEAEKEPSPLRDSFKRHY